VQDADSTHSQKDKGWSNQASYHKDAQKELHPEEPKKVELRSKTKRAQAQAGRKKSITP
jgi:hypothetical protein